MKHKNGKIFFFSVYTPTSFRFNPNFLPLSPQLSSAFKIQSTPYKASNIKPSSVLLKKARNYFRIK